MRSLLLPLYDPALDPHAIKVSMALAKLLKSRVTALLPASDFSCLSPYSDYPAAPGWSDLVEQARVVEEEREMTVRNLVGEICDLTGGSEPAITLRVMQGSEDAVISRCAMTHDLVVFSRRAEKPPCPLSATNLMKNTLRYAGRPVLVITEEPPQDLGKVAVVAWNGSVEAARAVSSSLPLLTNSDRVLVVSFTDAQSGSNDCQDLGLYLRRHGITAEIQCHAEVPSVGAEILSIADAAKANLLVMGGYTRTKSNQTIFGLVTHHILEHCTLPLFFSR